MIQCAGAPSAWYGIPPPMRVGGVVVVAVAVLLIILALPQYGVRGTGTGGYHLGGERQRATREPVHIIILILDILQKHILVGGFNPSEKY